MTSDPPEIRAAQARLDEAVRDFVEVCKQSGDPLLNEQALFTGYAMVVEGMHYNEDGNGITSLGEVYDGGEMRMSSAVGLFTLALDRLRGIGSVEDG